MSKIRNNYKRLFKFVNAIKKNIKIAVIGDIILDKYIWGEVSRISPEAPVPVIEVKKEEYKLGASANVAKNIISLGASVVLIGIIGQDYYGETVKNLLSQENISSEFLFLDSTRQTTIKIRVIGHSQQVVRIDYEDTHPSSPKQNQQILEILKSQKPDGIIIEDYNKGMISRQLVKNILSYADKEGIIVSADPHPSRDYSIYKGVYTLTPNKKETYALLGEKPTPNFEVVAHKLFKKIKCEVLLITLGEQGMFLLQDKQKFYIPAKAKQVYDVTGAGDTVIAVFTTLLACGIRPQDAAIISNYAGGIVISKLGTASITKEELLQAIKEDVS